MSGNQNWQDRRGMFQKGKEIHTPSAPGGQRFSETGGVASAIRRASTSSTGGGSPGSPVEKTTSNTGGMFPTAGSGRRRSSAASGGGLFNNLQNVKRGSNDYGDRRASAAEMNNSGGIVSGWFNSTFKGAPAKSGDQK